MKEPEQPPAQTPSSEPSTGKESKSLLFWEEKSLIGKVHIFEIF